jgi:hypothetical protein
MPKLVGKTFFQTNNWGQCLHEINNVTGVGVVNSATSKNLVLESSIFPHRNIYKFTWTSPVGKTNNQIDHMLIERRRHSVYLTFVLSGEQTVMLIIIWW